jgi:hypothetical protein
MRQSKAEAIVARLLLNAADLKNGSVSVTAQIHNGRVVEVLYATTENIGEPGEKPDNISGKTG